MISTANRIEKNGVNNAIVFNELQNIRLEIENEKYNKTANLFNAAVADYNDGINLLNEYINYKNKQFSKKSDPEIQNKVDSSNLKLKEAKTKFEQVDSQNVVPSNLIKQLSKSIEEAIAQVKEQQDWLRQYFSKGKLGRRSMFLKEAFRFP